MSRPRRVSDRYVYILETKAEYDTEYGPLFNEWVICAGPFYGHTRIEARRLALERLADLTWNHRLAFGSWNPNRLRVKGIRIHMLHC